MIRHGSSSLREALPAKPGNPRIRIEDEPPLHGKDIRSSQTQRLFEICRLSTEGRPWMEFADPRLLYCNLR
jgi:hypothetical protein